MQPPHPQRLLYISGAILVLGLSMLIAGSIMMGIGVHKSKQKSICTSDVSPTSPNSTTTAAPATDRDMIRNMIRDGIKWQNIQENLRDFTKKPHLAGTEANKEVADMIKQKWRSAGLEDVHEVSYNVLLTYPEWDNPNTLSISQPNGDIVFKTNGTSPAVLPEQQDPGAGIQWLAFSPNGSVTGDVVYCHFGSAKDFQELKDRGINLAGKIALIRYGVIFRGDKVAQAEKAGAIGAILYTDPAEGATLGTLSNDTYPNTYYMPPEGVQRGTLYIGDGDPLTPLYPSKPNLWKSLTLEEALNEGDIPTIPCLPISYTAAQKILSRMNPPEVYPSWKGAINTTYNYGPGLQDNMNVTIDVHAHFENRTIQNIIGYIYGTEEQDRYVILGNHYDAWVYGAMDPNAGTAALAEVARSIGQTVQQTGWRPARTIMFANWDAEEYGTIGSAEFIEEFASILMKRAVVYLNMDCLKGNVTLYVQASPVLNDVLMSSAKNVPNPNQDELSKGRKTVYDTWLYNFADTDDPNKPYVQIPNGGSDHKSFLTYLGIPVVNFYFLQYNDSFTYPLYHTLYETPFAIENLMDIRNYSTHVALAQYWAEMSLSFADSPTVPYKLSDLTQQMSYSFIPQLKETMLKKNMSEYTADGLQQLDYMSTTSKSLAQQAMEFDKNTFSFDDDIKLRIKWNDRMTSFQNCFVNPHGTPGDPTARHVLFSTSKTDSYAGSVMQQVYAILNAMTPTTDPSTLKELSRELANQISIVHYSLQCAGSAINNFI